MPKNRSKLFPPVTNRVYYKYSHIGTDLLKQLGFDIEDYDEEQYQVITKENEKTVATETHYDHFVFTNSSWAYSCSTISRSIDKKHFCVGGPLNGQLKAQSQACDYSVFNNADRCSDLDKTLLIWNQIKHLGQSIDN